MAQAQTGVARVASARCLCRRFWLVRELPSEAIPFVDRVRECENHEASARVPAMDEIVWHCFPVAEATFITWVLRKNDMELALETFDGVLREILENAFEIEFVEEP